MSPDGSTFLFRSAPRGLDRKRLRLFQQTLTTVEGEESLGELAISAPRAKTQAAEFGHPIETEIEILMLHGTLHLLGHDHETDKGAMRRLETRWREKLGLPAGLIERTRR
jgi:probable rRNA maturation factor